MGKDDPLACKDEKNDCECSLKNVGKKSLDKITGKFMLKACHISHQSLYYPFQDRMDVLEYSVRKKTMLEKAIAGELNVSIFSMSESKFVEMLVGMGAYKVRNLFKQPNEKEMPSVKSVMGLSAETMKGNKP